VIWIQLAGSITNSVRFSVRSALLAPSVRNEAENRHQQHWFTGDAQWACGMTGPRICGRMPLPMPIRRASAASTGLGVNMPQFEEAFLLHGGQSMVKET